MRAATRRNVLWALMVLAGVVVVVAVVTSTIVSARNTALIRQTQLTNTGILKSTKQTAELVEECTTPGGECYERGQENTGKAVSDIGRVTVLAAACAASLSPEQVDVPTRADMIQRCIEQQLSERR